MVIGLIVVLIVWSNFYWAYLILIGLLLVLVVCLIVCIMKRQTILKQKQAALLNVNGCRVSSNLDLVYLVVEEIDQTVQRRILSSRTQV